MRFLSKPPIALPLLLACALAVPGRSALARDPHVPPAPGGSPAQPTKPADVPASPAPPAAGSKMRISDFRIELAHFAEYLRVRKSDSKDIIDALGAVVADYARLAPDLVKDKRTGALSEEGPEQFKADETDAQKDAEKLYLKALELVKLKGATESNERDDVNVKAAQALATVRADAREQIIKDLGAFIDLVLPQNTKMDKFKVPAALYEETFKTIGLLSDAKNGGIAYLQTWIKYEPSGDTPEKIRSALGGLVVIKRDREHVSGKARLELVSDMIKTYAGPEGTAEHFHPGTTQNGTKIADPRVTWDGLKSSVIKALQYFCLEPKEADGGLIASVAKFERWQREHKDPKRDPWLDPLPGSVPPPK